jgi:hypothetical protein
LQRRSLSESRSCESWVTGGEAAKRPTSSSFGVGDLNIVQSEKPVQNISASPNGSAGDAGDDDSNNANSSHGGSDSQSRAERQEPYRNAPNDYGSFGSDANKSSALDVPQHTEASRHTSHYENDCDSSKLGTDSIKFEPNTTSSKTKDMKIGSDGPKRLQAAKQDAPRILPLHSQRSLDSLQTETPVISQPLQDSQHRPDVMILHNKRQPLTDGEKQQEQFQGEYIGQTPPVCIAEKEHAQFHHDAQSFGAERAELYAVGPRNVQHPQPPGQQHHAQHDMPNLDQWREQQEAWRASNQASKAMEDSQDLAQVHPQQSEPLRAHYYPLFPKSAKPQISLPLQGLFVSEAVPAQTSVLSLSLQAGSSASSLHQPGDVSTSSVQADASLLRLQGDLSLLQLPVDGLDPELHASSVRQAHLTQLSTSFNRYLHPAHKVAREDYHSHVNKVLAKIPSQSQTFSGAIKFQEEDLLYHFSNSQFHRSLLHTDNSKIIGRDSAPKASLYSQGLDLLVSDRHCAHKGRAFEQGRPAIGAASISPIHTINSALGSPLTVHAASPATPFLQKNALSSPVDADASAHDIYPRLAYANLRSSSQAHRELAGFNRRQVYNTGTSHVHTTSSENAIVGAGISTKGAYPWDDLSVASSAGSENQASCFAFISPCLCLMLVFPSCACSCMHVKEIVPVI